MLAPLKKLKNKKIGIIRKFRVSIENIAEELIYFDKVLYWPLRKKIKIDKKIQLLTMPGLDNFI